VPNIFIWKNAPSAAQIAGKDRANRQKVQPVKRLRRTTHSSAEFLGDIDMEVAGVVSCKHLPVCRLVWIVWSLEYRTVL